jgi:hypothetical protein
VLNLRTSTFVIKAGIRSTLNGMGMAMQEHWETIKVAQVVAFSLFRMIGMLKASKGSDAG